MSQICGFLVGISLKVFRSSMMPRLRRRAAWAPPVCPAEMSSGENILPSPSTRHKTNGVSSCAESGRHQLTWRAMWRTNVRSVLWCFSQALASVFLLPFSMPIPICELVTFSLNIKRPNKRSPYLWSRRPPVARVRHSFPPSTCSARWSLEKYLNCWTEETGLSDE